MEVLLFYRRLNAALTEIEAAKLETSNRRAQATGLLAIAGSTVFSPLNVVPALTGWKRRSPSRTLINRPMVTLSP